MAMPKINPLAIVAGLSVAAAVTMGVLLVQKGSQVSELAESNAYLQAEMQKQPAPQPEPTPKPEEKVEPPAVAAKVYVNCYADPIGNDDATLKCIDSAGATVTVAASTDAILGEVGDFDLTATWLFLVPGTDLVYMGYHVTESDADSFDQHVVYNLKTGAKSRVNDTGVPKDVWLLPEIHRSPDGRRAIVAGGSAGSEVSADIKHLFVVDLVAMKVVATIKAPASRSMVQRIDFRELIPQVRWLSVNEIEYYLYDPPTLGRDSNGNQMAVAGDIRSIETYKLK